MKIRLVLLESNERYLARIVNAISANYASAFELYVFTQLEGALECVQQKKIDVFLASEDFVISSKDLPDRCAFCYLAESSSFETIREESVIGKYQKLSVICKEIQLLHSNNLKDKVIRRDGTQARLLLFTSPAGGAGTSTLAAAYAVRLAREGEKVLYVNLEQNGDTGLYFEGKNANHTFENVLFELQSQKKNMQYRIIHMAEESEEGVSFFVSPPHAAAFADMSHEQEIELITMLQSQNEYPFVIVDMDYDVDREFVKILDKADRVFMVSDGSVCANRKIERALETVNFFNENVIDNIMLVYNRFSSKTGKTLTLDGLRQGKGVGRIEGASPKELVGVISEKEVFADYLS